MSDQKRWFKLWHSALSDDLITSLPPSLRWAWAALGAHTKVHGTMGVVTISLENNVLAASMGVTAEHLLAVTKQLPHLCVEEGKNGHGTFTVTWSKWRQFQEDSTAAERKRLSRSKRRGEEKRSEEKRNKPPVSPMLFPEATKQEYPVNEQGQCTACVEVLREFYAQVGRKYRLNGKPVFPGIHARHTERGLNACLSVLRVKASQWKDDPKMNKWLKPSTLYGPEKFIEYFAEAEVDENGGQ